MAPRRARLSAVRLGPSLSVYVGRQFLVGLGAALLLLGLLAFVIDFVELSRRAASRDDADAGVALAMAALRVPFLLQKVVPFAVLFGAMACYTRLTRTHELVVARASGVSAWQFLLPAVALAAVVGALVVAVFNPLSSVLVSRFEQLEARYMTGQASLLAVSPSGLWLREGDAGGQTVIHARRVADQGIELREAIFFLYGGTDRFVRRIDAGAARLGQGVWHLEQVVVTAPDEPAVVLSAYDLPTTLTATRIQESFASPETMSFWDIPAFVRTLEAAGFSGLRHRLHWHAVLSGPVLLVAMVLVGTTFSLRLTRRGGTGALLLGGLMTGFALYFLTDVSRALGLSGSLPPALAAWAPALVAALAGLALIVHLEEG